MDLNLMLILLIFSLIVLLGCRKQPNDLKNSDRYKEIIKVHKHVQDSVANYPNARQHKQKTTINSNDPQNYDWDNPQPPYDEDFENDKIRITKIYGADKQGAAFFVLRVLDKKRNIDRYFTDTWYLRGTMENSVDSTFSNVLINDYLEGYFCYNLESGMISKCFPENIDTVFNENLSDSVTVISGQTHYLSNRKENIDNKLQLKLAYKEAN